MPPDFIFNVWQQFFQTFALVSLATSTIFLSLIKFLKVNLRVVLAVALFVVLILFSWARGFYNKLQNSAFENWKAETEKTRPTLAPIFLNENLSINNTDFAKIVNNNPFVLDARENIEYEYGRFPGSTHIRFADLLAGDWTKLPTGIPIYVMCWSGIRGKETVNFLRQKNINAIYLENGADGWHSFGGVWEGEIKFTNHYPQLKYLKIFSTQEVKEQVATGKVFLIDTREIDRYQKQHISNSLSFPILRTPSVEIPGKIGQIPRGQKVITVCDDYVNCFDAKLVGVEVEKNGYEFLGRYNKPWEYEK